MSQELKNKLFEIIFEAETPTGKKFDIVLLWVILISVGFAMLETVPSMNQKFGSLFYVLEWIFTIIFTIEYGLRIYCIKFPKHYIFSFFGMIDLLSIIPTYLSFLFPGSQSLIIIRSIRLLRIFRILKLARYLGEAHVLMTALKASRIKVTVFIGAVAIIVLIVGALMYLIEGPPNGFTSVPISAYWAIVTVTTVGFGDITPQTPLGQMLASFLMILGYGFIAIPTGIVSVELANAQNNITNQFLLINI
ncbi:MAG: ion transporter [Candidatus Paceibacterota bacterium]